MDFILLQGFYRTLDVRVQASSTFETCSSTCFSGESSWIQFFFVGVSVLCMIKSFDIMQKICTSGYMLLVGGDSRYKLSHQNFFSANHPMLIEFYLFLHLNKWRELSCLLRFWKDWAVKSSRVRLILLEKDYKIF